MAPDKGRDDELEARRILDRVARETEAGGSSAATHGARGCDHPAVGNTDADADDKIEQLGTRIGRILGLALTIGIVLWLILYLVRGG